MLRVGTLQWGECHKCTHFDADYGCKIIDTMAMRIVDDTVFCIDGEPVAEREVALEFEGTWE